MGDLVYSKFADNHLKNSVVKADRRFRSHRKEKKKIN